MNRNPTTRRLALLVLALALVAVVALRQGLHAPDAPSPSSREAEKQVVREQVIDSDDLGTEPIAQSAADDSDGAPDDDELAWDVAAWSEAQESPSVPHVYTIPEEAQYEPEVALVTVSEGTTLDEVNELLARTDAVATKRVTAEELASGLLRIELAEGADVEETVNVLLASEPIDVAQPNFIYYAQLGDESDFRELLDAEVRPGEEGLLTQGVEPAGDAEDVAQDAEVADERAWEEDDALPEAEEAEGGASETLPDELPAQEASENSSSEAQAEPSDPALEEQSIADDIALLVNDPHALPSSDTSWGLSSIRAYEAWTVARCEGTVGVAVFDWYPSYEHEDLVDTIVDVFDATQTEEGARYDKSTFTGHGTHVAGVVGATVNNGVGVAGVSYNANLLLANVFKDKASSSEYLIRAYDHIDVLAKEYNVRVVNVSVGGELTKPIGDTLLVRRINRAYENGIVTVAAAGNAKAGVTVPYYEYPGDATNVVSVINLAQLESGALMRNETSNYNVPGQQGKNISAPGTGIYSTYTTGLPPYASVTGTSMAAPHVSGVLALEFAANPELTAHEAVSVLYATALDLGDEGWDENFGAGEVNAYEAVVAASDPEVVKEISGDETYDYDLDVVVATPTISGPTRVPVGATAAYEVTDGSLRIKSGSECVELVGTTLRGVEPGKARLSVTDATGTERIVWDVEVYDLDGFWTIASAQRPSLVMGVKSASVVDKAGLVMQKATGSRSQVWCFDEQNDGSYALLNAKTGKAAHVWGASSKSGAAVVQCSFDDREWQHWYLEANADNSVSIFNGYSECALDIAGKKARLSAAVQQDGYDASSSQRWVIRKVNIDVGPLWEGVYRVSSGLDKRYVLEVQKSSKKRGANVRLNRPTKAQGQKWLFTYLGGGVYKVQPMCSTCVLVPKGGKNRKGTNVVQDKWASKKWQTWKVVANDDGSWRIYRNGRRLALSVAGKRARKGSNVVQARLSSRSKAQRWWLTQY